MDETTDDVGTPEQATPLPLTGRSELLDALRGPDGVIPRPLEVAVAFADAVDGEDDAPRLDDLVTPETRGGWDLQEAAQALDGVGFASQVTPLSDDWAKVVLVRDVQEAYRIPADAAASVPAYGLYLHHVAEEQDWRVHRIGAPDLALEDLTGGAEAGT